MGCCISGEFFCVFLASLKSLQNSSPIFDPILVRYSYRRERMWWELVVSFRKVLLVAVSTFGTLMRTVDLQAYLALFIVFASIVAHLVGRPFDTEGSDTSLLLHQLEFGALAICFSTFWGGLLFFLGHEQPGTVPESAKIFVSIAIMCANVGFFILALCVFLREFIRDCRNKQLAAQRALKVKILKVRSQMALMGGRGVENTARVVPATGNDAASMGRTKSTVQHANHVQKQFARHEVILRQKHSRQQRENRRQTQLRVLARTRLKRSRALARIPVFSGLEDERIEALIDSMTFKKMEAGDIVCRQGEDADSFYVVTSGRCTAFVQYAPPAGTAYKDDSPLEPKGDDKAEEEALGYRVGTINTLGFVGESMILGGRQKRTATVRVETGGAHLLVLTRERFLSLNLGDDVLAKMRQVQEQRAEVNRRQSLRRKSRGGDGDGDSVMEMKT